jgi:hypothetical protein
MKDQNNAEFKGQSQVLEPETYRDSIGTMEQSGKRKWVFPRKPMAILLYFSI